MSRRSLVRPSQSEQRGRGLSARYHWALAMLVLAPVVILPLGLNRFVFIKLAVVAAGAALAWTVHPRGRLGRPATALVAAGGVLLFAAALAGEQPLSQIIGRGPRYEGLVTLALYVAAAAAGARLLGPDRGHEEERLLTRLMAMAAMAVASLALLEAVGLEPLASTSARPGSLLGNASDQGAWALVVLGPLLVVALRNKDRWAVAGAAAAGVAVVTSASRGALVGAAVVVVVVAILGRGRERMYAVGALAAGAVATLALPFTRARLLGQTPLSQATVPGRQQLWEESLDLVQRQPLLGTGPSGFVDAIVTAHTPVWYQTVGPDFPPDSPHSLPLQAAMAGGLPLVALLVAAMLVLGWAGWTRSHDETAQAALDAGFLAGLAGYGAALVFHFTSPGATSMAALLAGALLSVRSARPTPPWLARTWTALLVSISVVLAAAALAEIPLRVAIEHLQRAELSAGDRAFDVARTLRPWDVEVCVTAGHAYAVLATEGIAEAPPHAARWLSCSERQLPLSTWVMSDRAAVAEARGDFKQAQQDLEGALRRDPYNPNLHLQIGIVTAQAGDLRTAEAAFRSAAAYAPTSPEPWANLVRLFEMQGKADEASAAEQQYQLRLAGAGTPDAGADADRDASPSTAR